MSELVDRALALHRAGRLDEAESLYGAALAANADDAGAMRLLGLLKTQQGKHSEALTLVTGALKRDPNSPKAHATLGSILQALNRYEEALASYDSAIAIDPGLAEPHYNRGIALQALGRHPEALASYDKALGLRPDFVEAFTNRGNALQAIGRYADALASYDQALAIKPDLAEALNSRAAALEALGNTRYIPTGLQNPAESLPQPETRPVPDPSTYAGAGVRLIAFYLPQYHPIPENDLWWGKGFTDWTNVAKARPLFPDHYQPHIPADLGFYDLRLAEAREAQAELAAAYGIHGFCYYYYWFQGRRLLERPLNEVRTLGRPRLPFCVCWANESWTRRWDGGNNEILVEQVHSAEDDIEFIKGLIPLFGDERYVRVAGKPLLLVYRADLFPDPRRTTEIWRETALRSGVGGLYLVQVQSFSNFGNPETIGFDAAAQFPGHGIPANASRQLTNNPGGFRGRIFDYRVYSEDMLRRRDSGYKVFRSVMPSWDNTPRMGHLAGLFAHSSPETYAKWIKAAVTYTQSAFVGDERLVFINAWNEWAEGCHLEPDQRHGLRFLEATRSALVG